MKRFLSIFLSLSLFLSLLPARSTFASNYTGSFSENRIDSESLEITLENYTGPEFSLAPYVSIFYSGDNTINLTSAAGFSDSNCFALAFVALTDDSKLTINQPSLDADSLALDLENASLYVSGNGLLKIDAGSSLVAVNVKGFSTSISGSSDSGPYVVDFDKIVDISSLASARTPFAFGLPENTVASDFYNYDRPGITYSYTADPSGTSASFSLLHEILGVNALLNLDLPENLTFDEAEDLLKSSFSRDDTSSDLLSDPVISQTTNSDYVVDLDNSSLLETEDGSYVFRAAFKSVNPRSGFTNLVGFCPIACISLNGEFYSDEQLSRARSDDGFLEFFNIPVELNLKETEPKRPEQPEQSEQSEQSEQTPSEVLTPEAPNTPSEIFIPKAPNTGKCYN